MPREAERLPCSLTWLQEGRFEGDVFQRLVPVARDVVKRRIAEERPQWLDDYSELR